MDHPINFSQSALIVIDIQPAILKMLNDENMGKQVIENSKRLINLARKKRIEIIFVRTVFTKEDFNFIPFQNKIFGRLNSAAEIGLEEFQESSKIQYEIECLKEETDHIIEKKRIGCFSSENFQKILEQQNITNLFICGIHTSKTILSTIYSSIDLDYKVIIVSDACADSDSQMHNVLMNTLFPIVGDVMTTEELKELLDKDN